ncbi:MAG: hypothetical protein SGJ04_00880 [Bacteroidota bacterium]|nr:hypothetical protein [Bacteroidota bacterium]
MSNYLLFLFHGNAEYEYELRYAIDSLTAIYGTKFPFQIIIYTDQAQLISDFIPPQTIIREINTIELTEWKGKNGFVHRIKACAILDACTKYNGNFIYFDTDVKFKSKIDSFFQHISTKGRLFHTAEGKMNESKSPKLNQKISKFLKNHPEVNISSEAEMYNCGVIGFKSTDSELIQKVIDKVDEMFPMYPKHVMEQLSFSWYLGHQQNVKTCENEVYHYWNFKEFKHILKFEYKLSKAITDVELAIQPKLNWESKSAWHRNILKLIGKNYKQKMPLQ